MKNLFFGILLAMFFVSGQASACEKWRWEFAEVSLISISYYNAYDNLEKKKISSSEFSEKTNKLIYDLAKIQRKLSNSDYESCPTEDTTSYAERRNNLNNWIAPALIAMKAHEFFRKKE